MFEPTRKSYTVHVFLWMEQCSCSESNFCLCCLCFESCVVCLWLDVALRSSFAVYCPSWTVNILWYHVIIRVVVVWNWIHKAVFGSSVLSWGCCIGNVFFWMCSVPLLWVQLHCTSALSRGYVQFTFMSAVSFPGMYMRLDWCLRVISWYAAKISSACHNLLCVCG